VSIVTKSPLEEIRDVALSVYRRYLNSLTLEEHGTLKSEMEELQKTQGWARLQDVVGGNFAAYGELALWTGEFDVQKAGIAAGEKRALTFPDYVIQTYNERFDEDGVPRNSNSGSH
jgi:hypothetical protein